MSAAPVAPADAPAPATGAFVLDTDLLGPLVVPDGAPRAAELEALARRVTLYASRARGDGTRRTYRSAWRHYTAWCHALGREPLAADPDTIAMYVVRRADDGCAVSTIRVALAAIRTAHLLASIPLDLRHPRLALVLDGITRATGLRPRRQAAPAVPDILRRLLATRPDPATALGARDRALLLLGFGAALRRAELVGLRRDDVETIPGRGLHVRVRQSKTDPHGKGQTVAVWANPAEPDFCPAAALDRWLLHRHQVADRTGPDAGARPLFCAVTKSGRPTGAPLSDKAVARLVKQAALAAGLDPTRYSGHSLRAGLATAAGDAGAGLAELMRQTRHKSTEVALGYLRPAELWRNNVTARLFQPAPGPDEQEAV
ncbi:MAG: tyrosine-type recombinase/integrase [Proteobacteria bacterium]|nr:tyrosine-type recombinase/integrase [Pseudomonadota bacterium]